MLTRKSDDTLPSLQVVIIVSKSHKCMFLKLFLLLRAVCMILGTLSFTFGKEYGPLKPWHSCESKLSAVKETEKHKQSFLSSFHSMAPLAITSSSKSSSSGFFLWAGVWVDVTADTSTGYPPVVLFHSCGILLPHPYFQQAGHKEKFFWTPNYVPLVATLLCNA